MYEIMIENHAWICNGVYIQSPLHGIDDTSIAQAIEG